MVKSSEFTQLVKRKFNWISYEQNFGVKFLVSNDYLTMIVPLTVLALTEPLPLPD